MKAVFVVCQYSASQAAHLAGLLAKELDAKGWPREDDEGPTLIGVDLTEGERPIKWGTRMPAIAGVLSRATLRRGGEFTDDPKACGVDGIDLLHQEKTPNGMISVAWWYQVHPKGVNQGLRFDITK